MQSRTKTIKLLEKPIKNNKISHKDQSTSPLKKPKRLTFDVFPIYHLEPDIISLTRSTLKEEISQIRLEIDPLENELDLLKRLQTELKNQIMTSRVIEKQLAIKTGEALKEFCYSEEKENFDSNFELEMPEKEKLNIKNSPAQNKNSNEKNNINKNSQEKKRKNEDLPLKIDDFENKWRSFEEKKLFHTLLIL